MHGYIMCKRTTQRHRRFAHAQSMCSSELSNGEGADVRKACFVFVVFVETLQVWFPCRVPSCEIRALTVNVACILLNIRGMSSFLWSLFIMTKRCEFLYVFVYLFIGTFRNHGSLSHLVSLLCSWSKVYMHSYTHLYKTTIYSYTYINKCICNSPMKIYTFPV